MRSVSRTFVWLALVACGSREAPVAPAPVASVSASAVASAKIENASWHPLLFRIDGAKPSWLLGTIHVPDARIATFTPALDEAIASANEVVGELDDVSGAATPHAFALAPDKSLSTELSPALRDRLKKFYEDRGLGALFPLLEHQKVWVVAVQVSTLGHARAADAGAPKPGIPIDAVILQRAKTQGKPVHGLETAADQLAVFDGLTACSSSDSISARRTTAAEAIARRS